MGDYTLDLQLFADGDGGEGAAPGENAAAAGQNDALLKLGVPEEKLRRQRKNAAAEAPEGAFAAPARPSWDELMADPEYNRQMQSVVRSRLKKSGDAQTALGALAPSLELMARQYGLSPEELDYGALNAAIAGDARFRAADAEPRPAEAAPAAPEQRRESVRAHVQKLQQQEAKLKETFPSFDLSREMKNPVFLRMTAPAVGVSVEDAYYAVHRGELQAAAMQVTAQKAAEKLSNSIRAGAMRPQEAGTSSQGPSSVGFDYSKASPAQREAIKDRIRRAAARGEKLYPASE